MRILAYLLGLLLASTTAIAQVGGSGAGTGGSGVSSQTLPSPVPNSCLIGNPQGTAWVAGSCGTGDGMASDAGNVKLPEAQDNLGIARSVEAYGAKCDGTTDDTVALQAAIDANPSGAISLPTGRCMVSNLQVTKSIHITGQGNKQSFLVSPNGSTNPVLTVQVDTSAGFYPAVVQLDDFTITSVSRIDAPGINNVHGIRLKVSGSIQTEVNLNNFTIDEIPGSCLYAEGGEASGIFVAANNFNCLLPSQHGIYANSTSDWVFYGGLFYGATLHNITCAGCGNFHFHNVNNFSAVKSGINMFNGNNFFWNGGSIDRNHEHGVIVDNRNDKVRTVYFSDVTIGYSGATTNAGFSDFYVAANNGNDVYLTNVVFYNKANSASPNKPLDNLHITPGNTGHVYGTGVAFNAGLGTVGVLGGSKQFYIGDASPLAYGVKCDASTDDTVALQAAIYAAQSYAYPATNNGGGVLNLPPGFCMVSGPLLITNGLTIVGAGQGVAPGSFNSAGTVIRTSNPTADVFTVTTDSAVQFDNFTIDASVVKTAGAAISLNGTSAGTANIGSRITRMFFGANLWDGVYGGGAAGWVATANRYHSNRHNNVTVAASASFPDGTAAGIKITDSAFYNLTTGTTCNANIEVNGGGAVHIANNKMKGCLYNVLLRQVYGNTGTLLIANNGMEDTQHAHIALTQATSGKEYANVTIVGNELSVLSSSFLNDLGSIYIGPGTPTTTPNWIHGVSMGSNTFNNTADMPQGMINVQDGGIISITGSTAWGGPSHPTTNFLQVGSAATQVSLDPSNVFYGSGNKFGTINWPSMTGGASRLLSAPTTAQNTTAFIVPGTYVSNAGTGPSATELNATKLAKLFVGVVTGPLAGQTMTFTVQTAGGYSGAFTDSTLTCTIVNPNRTCSSAATAEAAVAANGAWTLKAVTSATSGPTGIINASLAAFQ